MFLVGGISRSHRLKLDFQDENFKNLLVWNYNAKNLDIWNVASYNLVVFYQVCSNYAPGAQSGSPEGHMFYIGLYRENMKKSSCLKPQGTESWYLIWNVT